MRIDYCRPSCLPILPLPVLLIALVTGRARDGEMARREEGEGGREAQRQTDRQTDRQRQRDRETQREIERVFDQ